MRWAGSAETDAEREGFLEMARTWTLAALQFEGINTPTDRVAAAPAPHVE